VHGRALGNNREPTTFHAGYAPQQINSKLNGRTNKFGWLQAPQPSFFFFLRVPATAEQPC
jgi:hypothetical protein